MHCYQAAIEGGEPLSQYQPSKYGCMTSELKDRQRLTLARTTGIRGGGGSLTGQAAMFVFRSCPSDLAEEKALIASIVVLGLGGSKGYRAYISVRISVLSLW